MAGSVNKVTLVGNLGRDPEVRYTQDNRKIVHLSIATSERWKDRASGDTRERTEWHRVVIFNENLAEVAERFLTKGRTVYLEGALQTRKWQDQSGQERYTTEIVIQRFRGELVLLGGGAGGRDGGPEMGPPDDYGAIGDDYGRGEPQAAPSPRPGPAARPAARPPSGGSRPAGNSRPTSLADDLDDEIPF